MRKQEHKTPIVYYQIMVGKINYVHPLSNSYIHEYSFKYTSLNQSQQQSIKIPGRIVVDN